MKQLMKWTALMIALLFVVVSCQKDEAIPIAQSDDVSEQIDFRDRAILPPEILEANQMIFDLKRTVTELMFTRKMPVSDGNYIRDQLFVVETKLRLPDVDAALGILNGLKGHIANLHNNGDLTEEYYIPLDAELQAIIDLLSVLGSDNIFTDPRDGQVYKLVVLADGKTWMAENLNYETTNSWWYENNSAHGQTYGRLYTWEAAMTACPPGWHLPSNVEWDNMIDFYGGPFTSEAYSNLMASEFGGNGSTGFNALLGGFYYPPGDIFTNLGTIGVYWSSTEYDDYGPGRVWAYMFLDFDQSLYQLYNIGKDNANPCRCVQD